MSKVLVLGIGNVLMGDEGVGVHVVRELAMQPLPEGVECLDGGTGSFALLEPLQEAEQILLIDATADERAPGTVRRLEPKFSRDYPRTLTAHDIGLKDLLDVFHLTERPANVTLFAVSIAPPNDLGTELTPTVAAAVPFILQIVQAEIANAVSQLTPS